MACTAEKVIATATGEIGYKETGTNITKYAKYFDKNYPDFYNTKKQGAAWCDIFVDYCVMVNCSDEKEAEYVLCQPAKSCGAGCSFSYNYYADQGRTSNDPVVGCQVFFGTGKKPNHTGIVVEVRDDSIVTVEGNSDNMVKRHTYKKTSSRIFGYGLPRYGKEAAAPSAPAADNSGYTEAEVKAAYDCIRGRYGNGATRKQKLKQAGFDYVRVQGLVNKILRGQYK